MVDDSLAAARERRGRRDRVPRRGRRRLGHRGAAALARTTSACSCSRTRSRPAPALVALILAFGPVSGAHFNPVVTLADRILGGMSTRDASVYIVAQVAGACVGAMVANLMFDLAGGRRVDARPLVGRRSGSARSSRRFGLLLVILGVVRAGRAADGRRSRSAAYIAAAYWFTSSTSFANPAVTIARTLTDTFAGIAPADVPAFVVLQIVGGLAAVALVPVLAPAPRRVRPRRAARALELRPEETPMAEPPHSQSRSEPRLA